MSVGDVLDGAFKLYRANWKAILLAAAVVLAPFELLSAYVARHQFRTDVLFGMAPTEQTWGSVVDFATMLFILPLVVAAVIKIAGGSVLGNPLDWGDALRSGLPRVPALLGAWLLIALAVGGVATVALLLVAGAVVGAMAAGGGALAAIVGLLAFVLLLVGAVLVAALFAAAIPAVVLEEAGPVRGLGRSSRLMRSRLLPVAGILVLAGLVGMLLTLVLAGIPMAIGVAVGPGAGWILVALGGVLSSAVATPFLVLVVFLLYVDARVRHEGFDLQIAASRMHPPQPGAASPGG
jgi:hypothetical protein